MLLSFGTALLVEAGAIRAAPKNACACEAAGRVCRCGDAAGESCCGAKPTRSCCAAKSAPHPSPASPKRSCCGGPGAEDAGLVLRSDCGCGDHAPSGLPTVPTRFVTAAATLPPVASPERVWPRSDTPGVVFDAPDPPIPRG